jgi:hypothetical protein
MILRMIAFGIRAFGCLYVGYWVIFFGCVAFVLITSYLREHRHRPAEKSASQEIHYQHK